MVFLYFYKWVHMYKNAFCLLLEISKIFMSLIQESDRKDEWQHVFKQQKNVETRKVLPIFYWSQHSSSYV
jgi:hypothetical protein